MDQNRFTPEQSEVVEQQIAQPTTTIKNKIPTRLGLFIVLLVAIVVGVGLWWYTGTRKIMTDTTEVKDTDTVIASNKPIAISTDKETYQLGEPIVMQVHRGNFPTPEENYLELSGCEISVTQNDNPVLRRVLSDYSYGECKEYVEPFSFDIKKSGEKTLSWTQKMCGDRGGSVDNLSKFPLETTR